MWISQSEQSKRRVSTIAWHDNDSRIARAVESISENGRVFSKIDKNNQSGRFPVLQVEELERQKSKKVNKNTFKLSTKTWL